MPKKVRASNMNYHFHEIRSKARGTETVKQHIRNDYARVAEDEKIDAENDLKYLRMREEEIVNEYVARA